MEMSRLSTPIVCVVIGEGGSGGALGLGVGDRVAMLQHSFYSVISPEGCAAILWKSAERRRHAAEALKLTAPSLLKLGVIDDVIPEPLGGAHRDPEKAMDAVQKYLVDSLDQLRRLTRSTVLRRRQERIRQLGSFFEEPNVAASLEPESSTMTAPSLRTARSVRSLRGSGTIRLGSRAAALQNAGR
jgi:acetyl-CoA carboxylase carboxyl transferase subunit alpha